MAMVDVVSQQPTGGPVAQVHQLGPRVGSHLALFCIHRMNRVNFAMTLSHDDSTINIVLVIVTTTTTTTTTIIIINVCISDSFCEHLCL